MHESQPPPASMPPPDDSDHDEGDVEFSSIEDTGADDDRLLGRGGGDDDSDHDEGTGADDDRLLGRGGGDDDSDHDEGDVEVSSKEDTAAADDDRLLGRDGDDAPTEGGKDDEDDEYDERMLGKGHATNADTTCGTSGAIAEETKDGEDGNAPSRGDVVKCKVTTGIPLQADDKPKGTVDKLPKKECATASSTRQDGGRERTNRLNGRSGDPTTGPAPSQDQDDVEDGGGRPPVIGIGYAPPDASDAPVIGVGYRPLEPGAYNVGADGNVEGRVQAVPYDRHNEDDFGDISDGEINGIMVVPGEAVYMDAHAVHAPPPLPPLVDAHDVTAMKCSTLLHPRRRRFLMALAIAVVIVVVVTSTVLVTVTGSSSGDDDVNDEGNDGIDSCGDDCDGLSNDNGSDDSDVTFPAPVLVQPSPSPSASLSLVPSLMPTHTVAPSVSPTLTSMPTKSREGRLVEVLSIVTTDLSVLLDDYSPQGKARQWIVDEDGRQIDVTTDYLDAAAVIQRYALAVLYFSTDGDGSWRLCGRVGATMRDESDVPCDGGARARWLSSTHECEWSFVSCDGYGSSSGGGAAVASVNRLDFVAIYDGDDYGGFYDDEVHLNGTIPFEIGHLSNLRILRLAENRALRGMVPWDALFRLEKLEELLLQECALTGTLPFRDPAVGLGGLAEASGGGPQSWFELRSMLLYGNSFSGSLPVNASWPPNLLSLGLGGNELTGQIPSTIDTMMNLKKLSLQRNRFTGSIPDAVGNLKRLEILILYGNFLVGSVPEAVCALRDHSAERTVSLQTLTVDCAQREGCQCCTRSDCITDDPNECECIAREPFLEETVLGEIGGFAYLPFRSAEYLAFSWLLDFDHLNVHPDVYPTVKQRYAMAVLYYSWGGGSWDVCNGSYESAALTPPGHTEAPCPDGVTRWLSTEPECLWYGSQCDAAMNVVEINFESPNNLKGSISSDIGSLEHLQQIIAPENRLSGTLPPEMLGLVELETIDLRSNSLSGVLWENFEGLVHLDALDLSHNRLGGSLSDVKFPQNLTLLNLQGNEFTGDLSSLAALSHLDALYLQGNDFVGDAPDLLCAVDESSSSAIDTFVMDCVDEVSCTCCTDCCIDNAGSSICGQNA